MNHIRHTVGSPAQQEEVVKERMQELSRHLCALHAPLLHVAHLCGQQSAAITQVHCQTIQAVLLGMQSTFHTGIVALDEPDIPCALCPYGVLMRLRMLYRMAAEAQITLAGVSGLCAYGRLEADPSGSYFQLRQQIADLLRECGGVLRSLRPAEGTCPQAQPLPLFPFVGYRQTIK